MKTLSLHKATQSYTNHYDVGKRPQFTVKYQDVPKMDTTF